MWATLQFRPGSTVMTNAGNIRIKSVIGIAVSQADGSENHYNTFNADFMGDPQVTTLNGSF